MRPCGVTTHIHQGQESKMRALNAEIKFSQGDRVN